MIWGKLLSHCHLPEIHTMTNCTLTSSTISFSLLGSWRQPEVVGYGLEFSEGGLEVFDDLGGEDAGIGKVGGVFETFVAEFVPLILIVVCA